MVPLYTLLQPQPLPITPFIAAFRVGFSFCPAMPLLYFCYYLLLLLLLLLSMPCSLLMHNLLNKGQQTLSTQWRQSLRLQTCFEPGSEVHKIPEPRALPSTESPTFP